jgi:hypothetical protein
MSVLQKNLLKFEEPYKSPSSGTFKKMKPVHAKPSLYAHYFMIMKEIGLKYGYNIVVHGSMNRDLDIIAIPWIKDIGNHVDMIEEFRKEMKGVYNADNGKVTHHGRMQYVINLNRGGYQFENDNHEEFTYTPDPQYYIDISVMPAINEKII